MDPLRRPLFNAAYNPALFGRYIGWLEERFGRFPFRVAETPLMLTPALRDKLAGHAKQIVAELSEPTLLSRLKEAIPRHYDVPGMDELPNCVQVDFALVKGPDGQFDGKVVELQGFPSLYALMSFMADGWRAALEDVPGLKAEWTCFIGHDRKAAIDLMANTILGATDPNEVVLVDYDPKNQKTSPDFTATQKLFGVDPVCVTELIKEGKKLYRKKEGRKLPVKRIYNRMVFDELEVKKVAVPFGWNDELDVTWCSHPNWYWTWSKFSLPFIHHPSVPRARFLSELKQVPDDLAGYVLKPLFSFAGAGVVVDVTAEHLAKVPADQRDKWVLQEKIEYAPVVTMPEGHGVKAEVRVMLLRPPKAKELTPLICLVRFSRGKMIGVDFNKELAWVGGSVGIWPR